MANVIKHKRGSGSDPVASDLVVGEVAIRTDVGKLFTKMDNGSVAEIAGGGSDIAINTLSSSSGTGGGSATFNGSAYRFTLSQPPSVSAQQLLVSINGVIQKPVAGTGQPSEGFSVDGTDIILGDAPATGSDFFILTFKSLGVSEPADNSVTSAKIVDGAIVNADINASAAIAGTKISPDFTGAITGTVSSANTTMLNLTANMGTNNNRPLVIKAPATDSSSEPFIISTGNSLQVNIDDQKTLFIDSNGQVNLHHDGSTDAKLHTSSTGVSVTGAITGTGDLTIDTNTLHVDSSNNRVGIGTTSPSVKTQISVSDTTAYSASTISANQFQLSITNTGAAGVAGLLFVTEPSSGNGGHCGIRALSTGSGDSALTFSTRGSSTQAERMRIDSSGNVGIGITPNEKLVVNGNSSVTGALFITSNTSTPSAGAFLYRPASNTLALGSNSTERMRIDSAGRVGIGDTSPDRELVVKNASSNATIKIEASNTSTSQLMFSDSDVENVARIALFHGSGADQNTLNFETAGTSRLAITSSGNVGIGTISPTDKLHVVGTTLLAGNSYVTGNLYVLADNKKIFAGAGSDARMYHDGTDSYFDSVTGNLYLYNHASAKNITFGTEGNSRWYIYNNGHLVPNGNDTFDIGTTSNRVRNIYTNDLNLSNEGGSNDVDGTWGSFTIQEGAEDLFLINKRNGKKYKFNLMEVS